MLSWVSIGFFGGQAFRISLAGFEPRDPTGLGSRALFCCAPYALYPNSGFRVEGLGFRLEGFKKNPKQAGVGFCRSLRMLQEAHQLPD